MVFAEIKLRSVKKLVEKLDFTLFASFDGSNPYDVYYLTREKYYG